MLAVACALVAFGAGAQPTPATAELVITGGDIVTVNDAQPSAEAVAVRDGRIIAVGPRNEVMKLQGARTQVMDLGGRTLIPGFVDAHGHISGVGAQAVAANLLAPPDGDLKDIAGVQAKLREWSQGPAAAKLGWLVGFGYDDALLAEKRHPTRDELDAVSKDVPILIVHQSSHLGVANSKALELAGITSATPNPTGGVIRRREGSQEPNGVLEETAFWAVLGQLPKLSPADGVYLAMAGQDLYLSFGFTTAQEGRAMPPTNALWESLASRGELKLDVVSYTDVTAADIGMKSPYVGRDYRNRFRIAGVKMNLDGSPQGKTAWLTQPYLVPPDGQKAGYLGYPALTDEQVMAFTDKAFASQWQLLAHAGGDAAIDQFIRAVRAAEEKYGRSDRRPVLIHGHVTRPDQLDACKELGIFPAFFPMHTFYWGDWHRSSVFGPVRGANISPTGWALQRGMIFSSHHDAPVAYPDSLRVLSATINRVARGSGDVVGPEHRVTPIVGLKAMTLWAAYQHFEEKSKGSIEVGKVADFVVLSQNPITIDPLKIADIQVMETIKGGRSVYKRDPEKSAGPDPASCAASPRCFTRMGPIAAGLAGIEPHAH
jgi:hypothetical protein